MKTIYKYLKNHETGDLINSQEFTETNITGMPIYYYRNDKSIDTPNLKGYVAISEKKYNRLMRNFQ